MKRLWDRRWRVTIGSLASDDVDIKFKIARTLQPKPGTCELDVYNLTETHRAQAKAARRPLVRIEAGYVDTGLSLLFQGDARKVETVRDETDWITRVTGGDGEYALRTARAARAFSPETKLEDVARYVADVMGVGEGNVVAALRGRGLDRVGATFPAGTVVHGRAARELTVLLRAAGLEWSVQNGVLQVFARGAALSQGVIRLEAGAGLVGSPEIGKGRTAKARSLLIPDLAPGRLVQLASATATGVYRIEKAEYNGETRGDDWYVDLEMKEHQ